MLKQRSSGIKHSLSPSVRRFPYDRKGSAGGRLQPLVGREPRGRWLLSLEGRYLRPGKGRLSRTTLVVNTFIKRAEIGIDTSKLTLQANSQEASGDHVSSCLPSRLSRVRVPS